MSFPIHGTMTKYLLLAALILSGCGEDGPQYYTRASRAEYRGVHVLKLVGTPMEMGLQHGELMADVLPEGVEFIQTDPTFSLIVPMARSMGLLEDAYEYSFPETIDECKGMTEAARRAGVEGWDMDTCISLAYGDVIFAFVEELISGGCSQFAAAGVATTEGQLVHGRNMDWSMQISYFINHPTVVVRRPEGKIPYATIAYPGSVTPQNAINAEGIAIGTNDATADQDKEPHARGRSSHFQMATHIMTTCKTLDEVESYLRSQEHSRSSILLVSDATNQTAAVFDMSANHMGVVRMDADGLVYTTNHFTHPDRVDLHVPVDPEGSSAVRLQRLAELLTPEGKDSLYGQIDAAKGIEVLRDRTNPVTGETYPPDVYDNNGSLANNGALWSMIFLPEKRDFYLASGAPPVPSKTFVGFSLDKLLKDTDDFAPDPADFE